MVQLSPTECTSLVLNGYSVRFPAPPNLFKHYNGKHGRWRPEVWKEDFGTTPPCLRGVPAFDQVMDDKQRARTREDHPPDLGGMSLAEVGLALKTHLLALRSNPAALVVKFVLRHSGLERKGISKDILTFPLSFCPTAAEMSLALEAGRA